MKKRTLRTITASCVFVAGSLLAQPADPVVLGFAVPGTPVIDGVIDDAWDAAPQYPIENFIPKARSSAVEPENHSGWWKAMYDDENLYVLVSMLDDMLTPLVNSSIDDADNVEVFISGTYTRTFTEAYNVSVYDFNDYQLRFGIGEAAGLGPQIGAGMHSTPFWMPEPGVAETNGVKYKTVATDGGYLMEIQIGLELAYEDATFDFRETDVAPDGGAGVDETNFRDYRKIGFEISVTDTDSGSGKEQRTAWANYENMYPGSPVGPSDVAWMHPGTWGTLVFVAAEGDGNGNGEDPTDAAADYYEDSTLHWLYYFGGGWSLWVADDFSSNWGYLYLGETYDETSGASGWLYHLERGWVYFLEGSVTASVFVYSADLGWLVASESYGAGQYYRYETEDFETWIP